MITKMLKPCFTMRVNNQRMLHLVYTYTICLECNFLFSNVIRSFFFYLIIIRIKYSKYKNLQYIILNSNGIIRII